MSLQTTILNDGVTNAAEQGGPAPVNQLRRGVFHLTDYTILLTVTKSLTFSHNTPTLSGNLSYHLYVFQLTVDVYDYEIFPLL